MKNARFLCSERSRARLALLPVGRGSFTEFSLSWLHMGTSTSLLCTGGVTEEFHRKLMFSTFFFFFFFCNIPLESKIPWSVNLKYSWSISLPLQCPSNQEKLEMGHERYNLLVCWCLKEAKEHEIPI